MARQVPRARGGPFYKPPRTSTPKNPYANFWNSPYPLPGTVKKPCIAAGRLSAREKKLNAKARRHDPYARIEMLDNGMLKCADEATSYNVMADIDAAERQRRRQLRVQRREQARERKYKARLDALVSGVGDMTLAVPEGRDTALAGPESDAGEERLTYPDEEWEACQASSSSSTLYDASSASQGSMSVSDASMPATPREGSPVSVAVQGMHGLHVATPEERLMQELNDNVLQARSSPTHIPTTPLTSPQLDLSYKPTPPPLPNRRTRRLRQQANKPYAAAARRHAHAAEAHLPDDAPIPTAGDVASAATYLMEAIQRTERLARHAETAGEMLAGLARVAFARVHGAPPPAGAAVEEALAPERVVVKARQLRVQLGRERWQTARCLERYCLACQYAGMPVTEYLVSKADALIAQ
ncbi:hypothetical protein HDZ31DRAFT_48846 [Schizophyllum fasciatum]